MIYFSVTYKSCRWEVGSCLLITEQEFIFDVGESVAVLESHNGCLQITQH